MVPRGLWALFGLLLAVSGHIRLVFPPARQPALDFYTTANSRPPCGVSKPPPGQGVHTFLKSGSEIDVEWLTSIPHMGGIRIEVLNALDQPIAIFTNFIDAYNVSNPRKTISLPKEFECENCAIRLTHQATEYGTEYQIYSCADVNIVSAIPDGDSCLGHGTRTSGVCRCEGAYTGEYCQIENECAKPTDCGAHGTCRTTVDEPRNQCYCQKGYYGTTCERVSRAANAPSDFDASRYRVREADDNKIYWRIDGDEIEFVLKFPGQSWAGIGWKPQDHVCPQAMPQPELYRQQPVTYPKKTSAEKVETVKKVEVVQKLESVASVAAAPAEKEHTHHRISSGGESDEKDFSVGGQSTEYGDEDTTDLPFHVTPDLMSAEKTSATSTAKPLSTTTASKGTTTTASTTPAGTTKTSPASVATSTTTKPPAITLSSAELAEQIEEQAVTCGPNEVFSKCPEMSRECEASCDWTRFPETIPNCPRQCGEPRCVCKEGLVRQANDNSQCVPFEYCAAEEDPHCPANATYAKCGTACEPSCENMYDTSPCPATCEKPDCTCADNHVRFNGVCIMWEDCPNVAQQFADDTVKMVESAEVSSAEVVIKTTTTPGTTKKQLKPAQTVCPVNETMTECGRACEADCATIATRAACDKCEDPDCACIQGFARSNGGCVYWGECPKQPRNNKANSISLQTTRAPTTAARASTEHDDSELSTDNEKCYGDWRYPEGCKDCDYKISWNYVDESDEIEFSLETKAPQNWWTGVGFSPSGSMADADMIIVKSANGKLSLLDMSSSSYGVPSLDASQDVYSTSTVIGTHANGVLRAQFTRKRSTGDAKDLAFSNTVCQHFLFPVEGGRLDENGNITIHASTPIVSPNLVCVASCLAEEDEKPTTGKKDEMCETEYRYPPSCVDTACEYIAKWSYDEKRKDVKFEISSKEPGRWTGIGFSRDGGMANSDIYTGWVYEGKGYVTDRYAYGRQLPAIDPADRNDIYEVEGKMVDEMQTISFRRPLVPKDKVTDLPLDECYYFLYPIGGGSAMSCTDMVVGSVFDGKGRVRDMYSPSKATPRMDSFFGGSDDLSGASAYQEDGVTTIVFRRKLEADHPADHTIAPGPMTVVWAKGADPERYQHTTGGAPIRADPAFFGQDLFKYHGKDRRGVLTINFFDAATEEVLKTVSSPSTTTQSPAARPLPNIPDAPKPEEDGFPSCSGRFSFPRGCERAICPYYVEWNSDGKEISFRLEAALSDRRWTAIGFSNDGGMANSDVVVISVERGEVSVVDQFMPNYGRPVIDEEQDVYDIETSYKSGRVMANFSRRLATNDMNDVTLAECQYFLFTPSGGQLDSSGEVMKHAETPTSSQTKICLNVCERHTTVAADAAAKQPTMKPVITKIETTKEEKKTEEEDEDEDEDSEEYQATESSELPTTKGTAPSSTRAPSTIPGKRIETTQQPAITKPPVVSYLPDAKKRYSLRVRILNRDWHPSLLDPQTEYYRSFTKEVSSAVDGLLAKKWKGMHVSKIVDYAKGSVIAEFEVDTNGQEPLAREVAIFLEGAALRGELPGFDVEPTTVKVKQIDVPVRPAQKNHKEEKPMNESIDNLLAGLRIDNELLRNIIVISIAALVLLLALVCCCCIMCRIRRTRNQFSPMRSESLEAKSYTDIPYKADSYPLPNPAFYGPYGTLQPKGTKPPMAGFENKAFQGPNGTHQRHFSQATTASNKNGSSSPAPSGNGNESMPDGMGETTYHEWYNKVASKPASQTHEEALMTPPNGNITIHASTPIVSPNLVCVASCLAEEDEKPTTGKKDEMCETEYRYPPSCVDTACEYIAKWSYDEKRKDVKFEISSKEPGRWTGIGFSRDGGMANSDIYTGWVYEGKGYVTDRYAYGRQLPAIDPADRNDIYEVEGKMVDEMQTISFRRPLVPKDKVTDLPLDECYYFLYPIGGGRVFARNTQDFANARTPIGYHDQAPKVSKNKICICDGQGSPVKPPHRVRVRRQALQQQAAQAATTGSAMSCTDMVVGSVFDGKGRVRDMYSPSKATPRMDSFFGGSDDLSGASAYQEDGVTTIVFRRKLEADHPADHTIAPGPMTVVWAKGADPERYQHTTGGAPIRADPAFFGQDLFKYHGKDRRGVLTINFFDAATEEVLKTVSSPSTTTQSPAARPLPNIPDAPKPEEDGFPSCSGRFSFPRGCERAICPYYVEWNSDGKEISFRLEAALSDRRWTAIGFSNDGGMANSDVVVISVERGEVSVVDQFMPNYGRPVIDEEQDVYDIETSYKSGRVMANFSRRLATNDMNDVTLAECQYFLFTPSGGQLDSSGEVMKHAETPTSSQTKICLNVCERHTTVAADAAAKQPTMKPVITKIETTKEEKKTEEEDEDEDEDSEEYQATESSELPTTKGTAPSSTRAPSTIPGKRIETTQQPAITKPPVVSYLPDAKKRYSLRVRILNRDWHPSLLDPQTEYYRSFTKEVSSAVDGLLAKKWKGMHVSKIVDYAKGSVIAEFEVDTNGQEPLAREVAIFLEGAALRGELPGFDVEPTTVKVKQIDVPVRPAQKNHKEEKPMNESIDNLLAGLRIDNELLRNIIVISIAALVLLLALVCCCCIMCRIRRTRNQFSPMRSESLEAKSYTDIPYKADSYPLPNPAFYGPYGTLQPKGTKPPMAGFENKAFQGPNGTHQRHFSQATTASNKNGSSSPAPSGNGNESMPDGMGETTYHEWYNKVASKPASQTHEEALMTPP
ncbi:unnamed protein product, partial [Mesorhabditis spiculigera]